MTRTSPTESSYAARNCGGHAQAADFQSFASGAHVPPAGDFTPHH